MQLTFGHFGQVVEKKRSISLQDITAVRERSFLSCFMRVSRMTTLSGLLQEECRQLSTMLGCEILSMLCVPVASRATGQVVALACAFNKQGGGRYKCSFIHCRYLCYITSY